jgi:hypothetical protein
VSAVRARAVRCGGGPWRGKTEREGGSGSAGDLKGRARAGGGHRWPAVDDEQRMPATGRAAPARPWTGRGARGRGGHGARAGGRSARAAGPGRFASRPRREAAAH